MDDGADEQEGIMLKARWDAMKPRIIRPLGTLTSSPNITPKID